MKLYSRGQVIFFSVLSGLIVLLFVLGLGAGKPHRNEPDNTAVSAPANTANTAETENEFKLWQTEYVALNAGDLSGYSESERENIAIYDQINPAVVNVTTETMAINWFL